MTEASLEEKDIGLRIECLRLACGRADMNPDLDVVTLATNYFDFCKGNKPTVEGVPADNEMSF